MKALSLRRIESVAVKSSELNKICDLYFPFKPAKKRLYFFEKWFKGQQCFLSPSPADKSAAYSHGAKLKKYRLLFSATGVTFRNADNETNTH